MNTNKAFGTFFLPGPTEVRQEILAGMMQPMIAHRGSAFEQLFERLQRGLRPLFMTERPVYVNSSSATGMMESAIRCAPVGRMLCLVNGAFSERFAHIASMCARDVDRYEVAWGQIHTIPQLDERLSMRKYAAITVVHSETSTGALNDVRAISDCAHRHGAVCLVDSVSGFAGAELRFDEWKLDYVLTGSQKALALPPGLSFAVASPSFVDQANAASRAWSLLRPRGARRLRAKESNPKHSGPVAFLCARAPAEINRRRGNRSSMDPAQSDGCQDPGMAGKDCR